MKKIFALMCAVMMTLTCVTPAMAKTPTVTFNGSVMEFESEPYIKDDFTMVPFRAIFEAIGATVAWDEETRSVIAYLETDESFIDIGMQIGLPYAFVKGEKVDLDVSPEIVDDFTFVPLRFVAENLGATVDWDSETFTAIITTN